MLPYFTLARTGGLGQGKHLVFLVFIFFTKKDWRKIALTTFIISLVWGYLLTSQAWPLIFFNFATRFLSTVTQRFDLGLHYSADIAPTLAVASILALRLIVNKLGSKIALIFASFLIITSLILFRFILHGPFSLAINPVFYQDTRGFKYLDKMIAVVPKNARVATQNNIASRFLHQDVFLLRENYQDFNPDYIVIDLRQNQNPKNFWGSGDIQKIFSQVSQDKAYLLIFNEGEQYVFRRKSGGLL